MYTLSDSFGNRLKEERIRLKLTQEELANKVGVRPITILQYEKGKSSPPIKFIYSLQEIGFNLIFLFLGSREIEEPGNYSPEVYKEIAEAIDILELKLGGSISGEARAKLTCLMLKQYSMLDEHQKPNFSDSPALVSSLIGKL